MPIDPRGKSLVVPPTAEAVGKGYASGEIVPSADGKYLVDKTGKDVAVLVEGDSGTSFYIDINVKIPRECRPCCSTVPICPGSAACYCPNPSCAPC